MPPKSIANNTHFLRVLVRTPVLQATDPNNHFLKEIAGSDYKVRAIAPVVYAFLPLSGPSYVTI